MDTCMTMLLAVVVGFFTHWSVGVLLGMYFVVRIWYPKPATILSSALPDRQKKLANLSEREDEEDDRQRLHRYGAYSSLGDKDY